MRLVKTCLYAALTGVLMHTSATIAADSSKEKKADSAAVSSEKTKKDEPKWDVNNPR